MGVSGGGGPRGPRWWEGDLRCRQPLPATDPPAWEDAAFATRGASKTRTEESRSGSSRPGGPALNAVGRPSLNSETHNLTTETL